MTHLKKKNNIGEYQVKSGRMIKENGDVVNVADRVDSVNYNDAIYNLVVTPSGSLVVNPTTGEPLENRHTVRIVNDSSTLVFLTFDEPTPEPGFLNITIFSGMAVDIRLSQTTPRDLYLISEIDTEVRVVEVN